MATLLLPNLEFGLSCNALLVLGALLFLMYLLVKMLKYQNQESRSDIPPGSRGLPFIGETLQFMAAINSSKGFYDFVRIRRLRYGNCFRTNIFGETHVFVSRTESAKAILNTDSGMFTKRYIKSIAELVGHQSLLCASQQHHKLIRSRLSNLFSSNSLSLFVKQFDELVIENLRIWEHKTTVVVLDEALKARKRIMSIIEKEISERRRDLDGYHEDFLQRLLLEDDKGCYDATNRSTLSDAEIQDNILTMIIAGQDTTASAITWMVKYLDENPENEQFQLLRKTSSELFLTFEDLNDMPYSSKVVKESLRMASVVPWFPRLALHNCEIEGFKIKKGWNVNIDAREVHLDPTLYKDPNKFNPSRFEDESKPYSFLAFGMGGRTCLGVNMAKAMMLVFLHRLITTYRWKVINPDSSIEKWAMFSRLKSGCPVTVTPITYA
ncbi:Cytochrome P450, E-class, group I [Parasponia andersonii]|uniref:Cytochrome P450, E-class, group I n=1 Tax=Parasponia andersonii TaxID=3476 RepID=A0A2P5C1N4_PARAD|nr:Cytochrome P450, E-class, group I [Parasponia andersonii]